MHALDTLTKGIDDRLTGLAMRPGDILMIDNYTTVHGRQPFRPTFNGRDRWLKRINISRDLRRSRDNRTAADSRVIY